MLDPKPADSATHPKPLKVLSKNNLRVSWDLSRDRTNRAGAAGVDNVTPRQFAADLDANLHRIKEKLHKGTYAFARLKPFFIQKPGTNKERVICVPTVQDRIVQKTIVNYLVSNRKFPIYNSSSFGFIKGTGTKDAIEKAVEFRSRYDWCIKADIEAFFDRIPRAYLKERTSAVLRNHSLVPIIHDAIDCEIRLKPAIQKRISSQGIQNGTGVRQGMPLSPLLSNLVLAKFDQKIEKSRIPMIRYADDLLLFFGGREEAKRGQRIVEELLGSIDLKLAETKTSLHGPHDPVNFLGRQIVFMGTLNKYVNRVSRHQMLKITDRLERDYCYANRSISNKTFNDSIVELSRSIAAYLGVYRDAFDYVKLVSELQISQRKILSNFYADIFGEDSFEKLSSAKKKFLGLDDISLPSPSGELDW